MGFRGILTIEAESGSVLFPIFKVIQNKMIAAQGDDFF